MLLLVDQPIWRHIASYAHVSDKRENIDFLQLPDQIRELALGVWANCIACGQAIHPLRARMKSERSRVAGSETERRLFYAPTCPTEKNPGCSRSKVARIHKLALVARLST